MAEASRLVLHGGFVVRWQDRPETAAPGSQSLMRLLSLHYLSKGYLVFADEPDFPRRPAPPPTADVPSSGGPPTLLPDEPTAHDFDTEILSLSDLARRTQRFADAEDEEDAQEEAQASAVLEWDETEEVPR